MLRQILILASSLVVIGIFLVKIKQLVIRLLIVLQGPFFAPTSDERIEDILNLVTIKPTSQIADIGSGDGRVLIALAKKFNFKKAVGYEIDPPLISKSRAAIKEAKLSKKIEIKNEDLWLADLSQYDVIVVYFIPRLMKKLEEKLLHELKPGAQVISVFFTFPTWKLAAERGAIRLYRKNR
jgi:protein-L-isoaspartate O-methyltransferase